MKAKILKNEQVAVHAWQMTLRAAAIAKTALPGQFLMVRVAGSCQPLLRRPLGVHYVRGNDIDILYEIVGEGTLALSRKRPGEELDILGPLGNGFYVGHSTTNILIAGGMGVAPLLFLAENLKKYKPVVLIGAKTKSHILCEKEFKILGCDVRIATDDGSKGYKGFVTDLLQDICRGEPMCSPCNGQTHRSAPTIFACGPHAMLCEAAKIAAKRGIPAQASLEAHMACGIGSCLGCVVNTKNGYKRVCKEGPVFDTREIIWQ